MSIQKKIYTYIDIDQNYQINDYTTFLDSSNQHKCLISVMLVESVTCEKDRFFLLHINKDVHA